MVNSQSCLLMAFILVLFIQILQTIVSRAQDANRTSRSLSTKEVITFYYRKMFSSSANTFFFFLCKKFHLDSTIRGAALVHLYLYTYINNLVKCDFLCSFLIKNKILVLMKRRDFMYTIYTKLL